MSESFGHAHVVSRRMEQILRMAARGWLLFPVTPCDKRPLIADWPNQATRDESRLQFWLRRFPGCNLGVATGPDSGVFILDVDGEQGLDALANLELRGCVLPKTLMTRTGRGTHVFLEWPPNGAVIRNSAGKLASGLDVRGAGGYAIVPPSVHPNGTAYEFVEENAPIAPAPDWLLEMLTAVSTAPEPNTGTLQSQADIIPEGQRNQTLMSLAGGMRRRGMTLPAIEAALLAENAERCTPPLREHEVKAIASSASRYQPTPNRPTELQTGGDVNATPETHANWPEPLSEEALYGLPGSIVRTIEPHTEADPAALLLQFLVAFGNVIGSGPHWRAEADRHALNLFVTLVGDTSKGRKGVSWGHVRALVSDSAGDSVWKDFCKQTGLSSGEGLIHAVRDPMGPDTGAIDKRLLVVESEFASTLRVMGRDGNTLSPVLRLAWDSGNLQILTRQSPATATGAHVSVIAHITKDELRRELTRTNAGNGFGNRFLWGAVRRSKALPDGGRVPGADHDPLEEKLRGAVEYARSLGEHELRRDAEARELWHSVYAELSEGKPGLFGAVTSRAEAQVMRLACLYALLDRSPEIRREHLMAALAVWKYCAASARFIFGDALGDPLADALLHLLRSTADGMTRTELSHALGRNRSAAEIGRALTVLAEHGWAKPKSEMTSGRPAERWFAYPC